MEKKKLRAITAKKPTKKKEKVSSKTTIPKSLEEKIMDKIKKEIRACFRDNELMNFLLENQSNHMTRFNKKTFQLFEKKVNDMLKTIEKIAETNEHVDYTLRNVLLAIRQNEYIQAWYPAQQGHPEMQVVGPHPVIHERKEKERIKR